MLSQTNYPMSLQLACSRTAESKETSKGKPDVFYCFGFGWGRFFLFACLCFRPRLALCLYRLILQAESVFVKKTKPGLSSYATKPDDAVGNSEKKVAVCGAYLGKFSDLYGGLIQCVWRFCLAFPVCLVFYFRFFRHVCAVGAFTVPHNSPFFSSRPDLVVGFRTVLGLMFLGSRVCFMWH